MSSGSIQIRVPFKQGWLLPNSWHIISFNLWDEIWPEQASKREPVTHGPRLGRAYFDARRTSVSENRPMPACCLMIAEKAALLLEPRDREEVEYDVWVRVGVVELFDSSVEWWNGCVEKIVTII